MSVEATDGEIISSLMIRLREVLIETGRLRQEDAERIEETMQATGLGFGEAAVHLGLLTPPDLQEAAQAALEPRPDPNAGGGIIEGVLNRRNSNRSKLPVKYIRTVKPGPSLMLAHWPGNSFSEQIRTLRTELLLLTGARGGMVTGVLSPCPGEGRTRLCVELAIAFSQLGQRTLLMDADLRRPRVHELFGTERTLGLGQTLATGDDPQVLAVENLPHLFLLTAGLSVSNPLELLTNGNFQRQMLEMRKQYRMIIIDTPPIGEFADGLAVASIADQVVIVGRTGQTPHSHMKEMLRRMGGTQARIVGAVINNF